MSKDVLLSVRGINKRFGHTVALSNTSGKEEALKWIGQLESF